MKIMATFDGTPFSEATLPLLSRLAALPGAEFTFVSVSHAPKPRQWNDHRHRALPSASGVQISQSEWVVDPAADPEFAESPSEAVQRQLAETRDYLSNLARGLPETAPIHVEALISGDPAGTIIQRARDEHSDVIVMATHTRHGIKALFGSTTQRVMSSGIAPVLVVHPAA